MGAVFALFAGFYYWIGKISGLQYPETLGQIHFWISAPLRVRSSKLTQSKHTLELSVVLKHLSQLVGKSTGEKQRGKPSEGSTESRKAMASYKSMDRLTNLNHYLRLSQEGGIATEVTACRLVQHPSVIRGWQSSTQVPHYSIVDPNQKGKGSRILRTSIEDLCTTGFPKGLKPYGNGGFIVPKLSWGRDPGIRRYATETLSLTKESDPVGVLENIQKRSEKDSSLKLNNLIGAISNPKLLALAYELIKSKPGNMTPGADTTTLDSLDLNWIQNTAAKLQAGQFRWSPARLVKIPKPNKPGQTRPLGIANPREKVVQKAIQLVLSALYEPIFRDCSHAFRPARSCHTALRACSSKLIGAKWVIEGDISKCFDKIGHEKLMEILRCKIGCQKTLNLLKTALQVGYAKLEGVVERSLEGTPQGSVLSPLLCNIFLHELDAFMEDLIPSINSGKARRKNRAYKNITYHLSRARKQRDVPRIRLLRQRLWNTPAGDPFDPSFKRCTYIRYADDFIIGVIGSKADAVVILNKVRIFLAEQLGLDLHLDKTQITHFPTKAVQFLGTVLRGYGHLKGTYIKQIRHGSSTRFLSVALQIRLEAPIKLLLEKLVKARFFCKVNFKYRPVRVGRLMNLEMPDILKYYNSIIRGYCNYYSFADNRSSLGSIIHGLKMSCALTLKSKLKLHSRAAVYSKFGSRLSYSRTIETKGKQMVKTYSLQIPENFKRLPFKERFSTSDPSLPNLHRVWNAKLTKSNLWKSCVICGSYPAEMHHLRSISRLRDRSQSVDFIKAQMMAINRKQVPLCKTHHHKVHGKLGGLSIAERLQFQAGAREMISEGQKTSNKGGKAG